MFKLILQSFGWWVFGSFLLFVSLATARVPMVVAGPVAIFVSLVATGWNFVSEMGRLK